MNSNSQLKMSWVESANRPDTPFPLNNLPYGVFIDNEQKYCGVAIGDKILNLTLLEQHGILVLGKDKFFDQGKWNTLMAAGKETWKDLRQTLTQLLSVNAEPVGDGYLVDQSDVQMAMPFEVTEYTDFYASKNHAMNVGTMFRGAENALPPNWLHIPIGYNGRASSVVVSGTEIQRPLGQIKLPDAEQPTFEPCKRFDIELELGAIVGTASQGPISVDQADENIFGYVLLNDWSARDIQAWEYQPLGPFQAKATATTISSWIVTSEALEPFRTETPTREKPLLDYLHESRPMLFDIDLEIHLQPENAPATQIAKVNYNTMYYSSAQQLAHHTTSGCPMRTGDLLGSGTISGKTKDSYGSLLELSWGGKEPITLTNGDTRSFLHDGDTVTLTGAAKHKDFTIGFGECVGKVVPARKG